MAYRVIFRHKRLDQGCPTFFQGRPLSDLNQRWRAAICIRKCQFLLENITYKYTLTSSRATSDNMVGHALDNVGLDRVPLCAQGPKILNAPLAIITRNVHVMALYVLATRYDWVCNPLYVVATENEICIAPNGIVFKVVLHCSSD